MILWLNDHSRLATLRGLLAPFSAAGMASHAVSYDVNHTTSDGAYLIKPVKPNMGVTLNLFEPAQ